MRELLADLARERFGAAAWKGLLVRSWRSSVAVARTDRAQLRSALGWVALGGAAGAGMIALGISSAPGAGWGWAAAWWCGWYTLVAGFLLTHLGMLERDDGAPLRAVHLPNGLTYLRLALAPLTASALARAPPRAVPSLALAAAVALVAATDLLDGALARRRGLTSRLGRSMDPMADIVLVASLAVGLHAAGALPTVLYALIMVRYPGLLVAVTVLYVARGPWTVRPTRIGRATSFTVVVVLLARAVCLLAGWPWPPAFALGAYGLASGLLIANLLYLFAEARRGPKAAEG